MKRRFLSSHKLIKVMGLCLAICFVAGFITACSDSKEIYSFSYTASPKSVSRGSRVAITTELTNASDKKYVYKGSESDFSASIKLFYSNGEYVYNVPVEPYALTTDYARYVIKSNESRQFTYYFSIPEDAPIGDYFMTLSYNGSSNTFFRVITVTE